MTDTRSGLAITDDEIERLWFSEVGMVTHYEASVQRRFSRRLLATFAERVADRLHEVCRHRGDCNERCEAARIVREAAK